MRNGSVQASFDALIQKHRIKHLPRGRIQPKGNVRKTQSCVHTGILFLQHANGINGFNAVAPGFFLTCGNGKCQAVHNNVVMVKAPRLSNVFN